MIVAIVTSRTFRIAVPAVAILVLAVGSVWAATITGTPRNDTLRGGARADKLYGKGGNDKLIGAAGNDILVGGPGNDVLVGGVGADTLLCGPGRDTATRDVQDKVLRDCEVVRGPQPSPPPPSPPPLPTGAKVVATIPLGGNAGKSIVTDGSVWVRLNGDIVVRIDVATNQVVARIRVGPGGGDSGIAVGEEFVWAVSDDNSVSRIDPATNAVTARITVGTGDHLPEGIGVTAGVVWVAIHRTGSVVRIDPATNAVTGSIRVGPDGPSGPQSLVVGHASVWVGVPNRTSVFRIDPRTSSISATVRTLLPCGGMAADADAVWLAPSCGNPRLVRIDPRTNTVTAMIHLGDVGEAGDVAVGLGSIWARTQRGLARVDATTGRLVGFLPDVGVFGNRGIAAGSGAVWLGDRDRVLRIEPVG